MPTVQQIKDTYPTLVSGVQSVFNTLNPVPNLDTFLQSLIDQSYALLSQSFYGNYYEIALSLWVAAKLDVVIKTGSGQVQGIFSQIQMRRVEGEYEVRYANFLAQTAKDFYSSPYSVELEALDRMFGVPFVVY